MKKTPSPPSPDHVVFDFQRDAPSRRPKRFKHPVAALFHILFKACALLVYLFGGLFGQRFLGTFVALILLISMDFWTVKNITGRLLAGLRWWNYIDEDGNSHWIFENKYADKNQDGPIDFIGDRDVNTADSQIFWLALILTPVVWFLLLLVTIFRLNVEWFMIVALALVLSSSNLYGYARCKLGTRDVKSTFTQFVGKKIFYNFLSPTNSSGKSTHSNSGYPSA